ncbi:hypothetical protein GA0115233_100910 [Streptomyces sp. DI166]|uniref:DUF6879 family protein n=1 Tax=Streptomyces sp. DI166 TaxID=1839783 RepID=UPI0007F55FAB|nr:DUF6879 family protein [Streptomyces sp. DI166]SBT89363.1 hypothetical protein GA0115233_100910 [Streptomyces sp. DI166]
MPSNEPTFDELMARCTRSAVHLEMRDSYAVDSEREELEAWRQGFRHDPADRASWWRPWLDLIQTTVARGVVVRRARIVSEPVSEYIRFEHADTFTNIAAGEQVRWLPRRQASAIALPGNDFWLFDEKWVHWNYFSGEGAWTGEEITDDPAAAQLCTEAFEAVWARAVPHEQYEIR